MCPGAGGRDSAALWNNCRNTKLGLLDSSVSSATLPPVVIMKHNRQYIYRTNCDGRPEEGCGWKVMRWQAMEGLTAGEGPESGRTLS